MTRRSSPFEEVERLLEQMGEMNQMGEGRGFALDLEDTGDAFVLTADLPGFESDDIDVELHGGSLRVAAERETESETETGNYIHHERTARATSRSVSLPEPVDEDGASASFQNGVLTVEVPKSRASDEDATSVDIE